MPIFRRIYYHELFHTLLPCVFSNIMRIMWKAQTDTRRGAAVSVKKSGKCSKC